MDENSGKKITDLVQELLQQLEVAGSVVLEEKDGAMLVKIETAEPGALIGHHGRSLEAIQVLLGQMLYKDSGVWTRLLVTVGDYRERREQQLKEMADRAADQVLASQTEVALDNLSPADRRVIHLHFSEHPRLVSESTGEGRYRRLVIKPKA